MDFKEARDKIQAIKQELEAGLELRGTLAGGDAAALVAARVRNEGKNADGGQFSAYSTSEVPAYWMVGRSRTGSADDKVKQLARKRETISYKRFRELNGLRVDVKNFEFTGELWRKFNVKSVKIGASIMEVTVGGTDQRSANLFTWLSEKEGIPINAASVDELALVKQTIQDWIIGVIKKHLP